MNHDDPLRRALWRIESRLGSPLSLETIADDCGLSRFQLARVFAARLGTTPMAYVQGRRLTEAARKLADGARRRDPPDILGVALDAAYGSHEAFSRAFRDRFGCSPSDLRDRGSCEGLDLLPPGTPSTSRTSKGEEEAMSDFDADRVDALPAKRLVGLRVTHPMASPVEIPQQWQRFNAEVLQHRAFQAGEALGLCIAAGEEVIEYVCAVDAPPGSAVPAGCELFELPARRYAVFVHAGHVSSIRDTWNAIFEHWLPAHADVWDREAPDLERYPPSFDPQTGDGGLELWLPLTDGASSVP